jgi:hypothetical protein
MDDEQLGQADETLDLVTVDGRTSTIVGEVGVLGDPEFRKIAPGTIFAIPASGQKVYRYVKDEAHASQFLSRAARGQRPFPDEVPILHRGASMFATVAQVLSRFRRSPVGVAEVTLEAGCGFYIAKTLGDGHYTVWGDEDALAARAIIVHRA